jgi:radical SAM superfamily enzyme YgiQ (UPF0313 family)
MKLILINPVVKNRPGLAQNFRSRHPPLSLAILAGLTPPDWEIVVQDENYEEATIVDDADLVGITSFTSQVTRAYELADQYRELKIPVILGGIHAWARQDEALRHFDNIVVGEAESMWPKVLSDLMYCGRYFVNHTLSGVYRGIRESQFALPKRSVLRQDYPVDSIQTSRGCSENCSFCSSHQFYGHAYRRQPVDLIVQDVQSIASPYVFVIDDNFRGFTDKHVQDATTILWELAPFKKEIIIQAPMSICQDVELLEAAREAGVRLIFIGLETGDQEGLALVSKRQNIKHGFDFSNIHKAGVGVIGSFIAGLDTDTPQKLRDRAKFMVDCGCDVMQLTIVTPLPGTRLFNQMLDEGRLLHTQFPKDWDRYDFTDLVYLPKGFRSPSEFYDVMHEITMEVFSSANIKSMARRTYDVTQSPDVVRFAQFLNYSYRDVMWEKAKAWKLMV